MKAWTPSREYGLTRYCGERRKDGTRRCEQCPGTTTLDGEPWGPCTHACHRGATGETTQLALGIGEIGGGMSRDS